MRGGSEEDVDETSRPSRGFHTLTRTRLAMILRQAPSRTFRSLFSTVRPASAQAQARTPVSFDDKLVRATAKVILDTTKGIDQGSIEWQRRQSRVEQLRNALGRHERANELLTTLRALALDEPDPEMRELAQLDVEPAVDQLEEARRELVKLVLAAPTHDRDEWSALVELKAGVGGSEAALFLATLLRMYQRCAARKGWRANVIEADRIQVTGGDAYKEAILEVTGTRAFETLRREAGVHRVQRVPQTESQGRVHTSTVSVIVLPTDPASGAGTSSTIPDSELFDPKDVKVETMRSRGAGGQVSDHSIRLGPWLCSMSRPFLSHGCLALPCTARQPN